MKFQLAALALASVAYSQTIASEAAMLPACALTCLSNAITSAGCGLTDYVCQCGSAKNTITQSATPCIITGCSTDDALKTSSITTEICVLAGSGSGSSTTAAATSSVASSGSSIVSSKASSATSRASSSSSSSRASSATSAAAASTTSTPAQSTGAASRNGVGALAAGAAAIIAFAL